MEMKNKWVKFWACIQSGVALSIARILEIHTDLLISKDCKLKDEEIFSFESRFAALEQYIREEGGTTMLQFLEEFLGVWQCWNRFHIATQKPAYHNVDDTFIANDLETKAVKPHSLNDINFQ